MSANCRSGEVSGVNKLRTCSACRQLQLRRREVVNHDLGWLHRLWKLSSNLFGHDQFRLLENRELHRGKKLGLDHSSDLNWRGLRTERRHRNKFRYVILPQLQPLRRKQLKVDYDEQRERNYPVCRCYCPFVDLAFGQQSKLKSAVSCRHAILLHWNLVGEKSQDWSLQIREIGQGVNVSTALDLQ